MKGVEHDRLWNQLEAEIHLHRHKTVIRACRGRTQRQRRLPVPPGHVSKPCGGNVYVSHYNITTLVVSIVNIFTQNTLL